MSSDPSGICVMDLQSSDRSCTNRFNSLHISTTRDQRYEKVDVVRCGMDDGEEQQHVRCLSMKPQILVEREEANFGSKPCDEVSTDCQHDEEAVHRKHKPCAPRRPYAVFESIQQRQLLIRNLRIPTVNTSGNGEHTIRRRRLPNEGLANIHATPISGPSTLVDTTAPEQTYFAVKRKEYTRSARRIQGE